jgi:hypothetical protein
MISQPTPYILIDPPKFTTGSMANSGLLSNYFDLFVTYTMGKMFIANRMLAMTLRLQSADLYCSQSL